MTEFKATEGDWLSVQQKYWDIWFNVAHQALSAQSTDMPSAADTWTEGFIKSWEATSTLAPPLVQDFFSRMLALSQPYLRLAGQFLPGAARVPGTATGETTAGKATPSRDGLAFWDLPLDTWRRTMSSMLPMPGDFLQAMQNEDMARVPPGALRERIDRFLSIPAVGYSREAQEQNQRFTRLTLDYFRTAADYQLAFMRLGARSAERFIKKVNDQSTPVDSLRKLYDLWIDACEDVYADYVMSDEYAEIYGRMVNALIAVKHQGALLVDETLESMNVPTRREINTILLRARETRRAHHGLRAELESMKDRVDAQARMLAELQQTDGKPS